MLHERPSDKDYQEIVTLGRQLYETLSTASNSILGINKLRRKVLQEIQSVEKSKEANTLKKEQITCSNLHHYEAFVKCLMADEHCVSVLEGFNLDMGTGTKKKVHVDIVSQERRRWKKVIARNPKALSQISVGDGDYQQKSIIDHANEYLACAQQNMVFFKPPVVEFIFSSGIESSLAYTLTSLGVVVSGEIIGLDSVRPSSRLQSPPPPLGDIKKVNLDVTAMIAYVSALTNGHADRKIRGIILNQHAEWERQNPVKPVLDKFFEGKELYACRKAMTDFKSIVDLIGGEGEKKRAEELYTRVTVVEDSPLELLEPSGQIKERGLAIFGTGQKIQAITVTANSAFVRAAFTKGIHLDVFLHEPRSLTEQKEIT